jgi:hypothetical protein
MVQKHSGIGIASFVIGILVVIMLCITFAVAGGSSGISSTGSSYSNLMTGIGLLACGTIALALVGVGLGIGGIVQKNVKKVFGIIGLVLNALVLLGLCGIVALGIMASGSL